MKPAIKYCAVYTRKSTEEGLEQDFNTLDAQREACLAFITSQKAEGWVAVQDYYDDGGFSGGNMERPALKRLMEDIKAGKVHIVVVYKIDRLTRSLMDFSKLVEVFDQYGVTFVSITQSFNTTTSMGRLTLNVLLSFAQFEREVIGERVRDKIAASKKKGMWMGGNPPIGYEVKNRQLIVDTESAKIARMLFEKYIEFGCVSKLAVHLRQSEIKTGERISEKGNKIGGKYFSRGNLYYLLANPIYIGRIRHKTVSYDGQHDAIIPIELWDAVQDKLKKQSATERNQKKISEATLLRGLLFDCEGTIYSPTFTMKKTLRYYYYFNRSLLEVKNHPKNVISRLPAYEIETAVENALRDRLSSPQQAIKLLGIDLEFDDKAIQHLAGYQQDISSEMLVRGAIHKVIVDTDTLKLIIKIPALRQILEKNLNLKFSQGEYEETTEIIVPYHTRRAFRGAVVIKPESLQHDIGSIFDRSPQELKNIVRGMIWRDEHFQGATLRQIAHRESVPETYVGKLIRETFLLI